MKKSIKRALVALALLLAALVPVGLTASPASAAGCGGNIVYNSSSNYTYNDGTWQFRPSVTIQRCTTTTGDAYAKVNAYSVTISRLSTGCGGTFGHAINGWRVNPDILGGWNGAEKEVNSCNPGQIVYGPGGTVVWASSPYDNRCIGGDITPKIFAWPDGSPESIPILCVI